MVKMDYLTTWNFRKLFYDFRIIVFFKLESANYVFTCPRAYPYHDPIVKFFRVANYIAK